MVKVRRCSPVDLHAVTELAQDYASFDTRPTFADIEGMYTRNPDCFFVAEREDGHVIGFISGYERKELPDEVLHNWKAKRVGYVDLMAVTPAHRGSGVGKLLLDSLLDRFREMDIDIVNLDVPIGQEAALGLYKKSGFEPRALNMRKRLRNT